MPATMPDDQKGRDVYDKLVAEGLTRKEIADICQVSEGAVHLWHSGKNNINSHNIRSMTAYLTGLRKARRTAAAKTAAEARWKPEAEAEAVIETSKEPLTYLVSCDPDRVRKLESLLTISRFEFVSLDG